MIPIDQIAHSLGTLFHGFPGAFLTGAFYMYLLNTAENRRTWRRRLRPNKVRAEYRAAILQARSVLRLIASTHFFEENLDAAIGDFYPRGESKDYQQAFAHAYTRTAIQLRATQRAWAGAAKPFRTRASDW